MLNYKRPALWLTVAAVITAIVIGLGFLTNPIKEQLAQGERLSYFAPTAKQAMEVYTKALLESDYLTLQSLTYYEFDPNGQEIWDTIKINSVKVINEDVRENKACYELELDIKDGGNSAFEQGVFPRWLLLKKGDRGWFVEGLVTSGAPEW